MKWFLAVLSVMMLTAAARPQEPPVIFKLGDRHGHAVPHRAGCTHLGGGNIEVEHPEPNEVIITLRGAVVAAGHPFKDSQAGMEFNLDQELKVLFRDPEKVKAAKLSLEAKIIGLLRSQPGKCDHVSRGTARCGPACVKLLCEDNVLLSACAPPHEVGGGENLSINCQCAPPSIPISPGCYHLQQTFHIEAVHPHTALPCWPASAEFAPDALNPKWIGYWEPFHGAAKKKFGFQVRLRVEPEETSEMLPPPKPSN